ncbi:hypothetical protein D3C86_1310650 [compost metagenome]
MSFNTTSDTSKVPEPDEKKISIQNGVKNTPMRLDILALKMAPGIFPPPIDTITTDEETVDGIADKNSTPTHNQCAFWFPNNL